MGAKRLKTYLSTKTKKCRKKAAPRKLPSLNIILDASDRGIVKKTISQISLRLLVFSKWLPRVFGTEGRASY